MCRSIHTLRQRDVVSSDEDIRAAALQYVRKVTGFRAPSERHQRAFDAAVDEIAAASKRVLEEIATGLRSQAKRPA